MKRVTWMVGVAALCGAAVGAGPSDETSMRATHLAGLLGPQEQTQLANALKAVAAGGATTVQLGRVRDLAGSACDAALALEAVRIFKASEHDGLRWAASNLSPLECLSIATSESKSLRPALLRLANGEPLSADQLAACDAAFGPNLVIERGIEANAGAEVVGLLVAAMKKTL